MQPNKRLILASGSAARRDMLRGAGLEFDIIPADIDEDIYKTKIKDPAELARTLAREKACHVSEQYSDALVIGSDQVLDLDGRLISKAKTVDEAREKLTLMRGKTHTLTSAYAIYEGGNLITEGHECADMTMHDFNDRFLDWYIAAAGDVLTKTVGAYAYEAHGVWLFKAVDGECFTILGMPLLQVLADLRV